MDSEDKRFDQDWINKTSFLAHLRCSYTGWLLDTGQITFRETLDSISARLVEEGQTFHETIERAATPLSKNELANALRSDRRILGFPLGLLQNPRYKIFGRPDGVRAAHGALLPIEIKSHKDVSRLDELELAFYWLLLEPYRLTTYTEPVGYIIARRDGQPEEVEVRLPEGRFGEVHVWLNRIRTARRHGVKPRICRCPTCTGARRGEILRATLEGKDLTLIFGIGREYAMALEALGLHSYEDLLSADPAFLAAKLRERKFSISADIVRGWRYHAMSWRKMGPVVFGNRALKLTNMVALDCEYDEFSEHIWMIGLCSISEGIRRYEFFLADGAREERQILHKLVATIGRGGQQPIVTWAGTGADLARLRRSMAQCGLGDESAMLASRHVDAFQYLTHSLRLPISSFILKDVAGYFNIRRRSAIAGGLEANVFYRRFRRARGERKQRLRHELVQYSRDDLRALIEVVFRLQEIGRTASKVAATG